MKRRSLVILLMLVVIAIVVASEVLSLPSEPIAIRTVEIGK